jgi:hypothetical protein
MVLLDSDYVDAINRADLAERSKIEYIKNLERLKKMTGLESIERLICNPTKVCTKLLEITTKSSRYNYMTAVMSAIRYTYQMEVLKDIRAKWLTFIEPLKAEMNAERESNKPTPRQLKTYVPWKDIMAMKDSFQLGSTEHMYLSLYTWACRRQLDYYNLLVYTKFDDNNKKPSNSVGHVYIPVDKTIPAYIHIVEGKTLGPGEFFHEELPIEVRLSIEASIINFPRSHLFMSGMNGRGRLKKYDHVKTYGTWANRLLQKLFDKAITVTTMRRSRATYNAQFVNRSMTQKKEEARLMAHSVHQSQLYHIIFDEDDTDMWHEPVIPFEVIEITETPNVDNAQIDCSTPKTLLTIDPVTGQIRSIKCFIIEESNVTENDLINISNVLATFSIDGSPLKSK